MCPAESELDGHEPPKLRVAAITPGRNVPSARYRVRQLIPGLRERGVFVDELAPAISAYPPKSPLLRPLWGTLALSVRLPLIAATRRYQMTVLQREVISTLVTLEGWTRRPRVLDVDDAIFLHRGGRTADRLARMCESVICGNAYLAEWFSRRHSNVIVLPTAVDTVRYVPSTGELDVDTQVIGWIGTSANLRFLHQIEDAIAAVLKIHDRAKLLVVSDSRPTFRSLPPERTEFIRWTPDAELEALRRMSVGVMPLEDSLWARGKCSFKMLVYMACGLPVVASPIGMNSELFALGTLGVPAQTNAEWTKALAELLSDAGACRSMGHAGRDVAEKHFSTTVIAPRLAAHLLSVAGS